MKRNLILVTVTWLLLYTFSWAQQVPEEDPFPIDDSVSTYLEAVELYGVPELKDETLKKANLRTLFPPIGNMGNAPAGQALGWVICYAATLTFRLNPADMPSPYFIFDLLANEKCHLPPSNYMVELERALKDIGCPRNRDYQPRRNCKDRLTPAQYQHLERYRITLHKLLAAEKREVLHWNTVLYAIRRRLDEGIPVIGLMKADTDFRRLSNDIWKPEINSIDLFTHAVVIVGYDDKTQEVEVANCWGKTWGDEGFGRIKYKDLYRFRQLYQISKTTDRIIAKRNRTVSKPIVSEPVSAESNARPIAQTSPVRPAHDKPVEPPMPQPALIDLQGTLRLRIPVGKTEDGKVLFEDLSHTNQNGIFQSAHSTVWPVGQQFQLVVNQLTPESYFYLFSIDPMGKISIHWPQKAGLGNLVSTPYSAYVSDKSTAFVLPRPRPVEENNKLIWQQRAFIKEAAGTDYLLVLHSSKELVDEELVQIAASLKGQYNSTELVAKLKLALGTKYIAPPTAKQNAHSIQYTAHSSKGYVVPIVVKID
ncbi:MAG: C1 family peptidase [Spirosomataceae bacterium]